MFSHSFSEESPPPDDIFRRKYEMLDSKTEARKAKSVRRRRMEIRRTKSVAKERTFRNQSSSSDECREIYEREMNSTADNDVSSSSSKLGRYYGKVSLIGRRREMEDAIAVELGFLNRGKRGYDFFGVYDGHGGWRVAQECSVMLHKVLVMTFGEDNGEKDIDWGKLMTEGFKKMDEEVNKYGAAVATTGSTAVVAVIEEDVVVVANCGDSRAVLSRGGAAIALSDDHKPDRPDELERIEVCGGRVINCNGQRVLGVLATSRSIGDQYLKPFVITEPEVKVIKRSDQDEFLILASDGLWDVVSNDLACQVTRGCLYPHQKLKRTSSTDFSKFQQDEENGNQIDEDCETDHETHQAVSRAAAMLAELAMARGSGDNISVIVVKLKSSRHRVSVSPPLKKAKVKLKNVVDVHS